MHLRRAEFSLNIRDQLDYFCAMFDGQGRCAPKPPIFQVHLGSMAYIIEGIVSEFTWKLGDIVILTIFI